MPDFPRPEHITELNPGGVDKLRGWLVRPNGSLTMGRVTFEAVEGGGVLVRTLPYTGPERVTHVAGRRGVREAGVL